MPHCSNVAMVCANRYPAAHKLFNIYVVSFGQSKCWEEWNQLDKSIWFGCETFYLQIIEPSAKAFIHGRFSRSGAIARRWNGWATTIWQQARWAQRMTRCGRCNANRFIGITHFQFRIDVNRFLFWRKPKKTTRRISISNCIRVWMSVCVWCYLVRFCINYSCPNRI